MEYYYFFYVKGSGGMLNLTLEEQIVRVVVAAIVGTIIGLERRLHSKKAGNKTHALICIVITVLTMVSVYGIGPEGGASGRILANLVTAVGFLCGGVIYHVNTGNKKNVYGLTTSVTVFGAACLGIPIGLGYYSIGLITLITMEVILFTDRLIGRMVDSGVEVDEE